MTHEGSAEIVDEADEVKHPREHVGVGAVVEKVDGIRPPVAAPVNGASIGLPV